MVKAEFLVSLSYLSLNGLERRGKFCFSCTPIEPVHFQLHAMVRS